MDRELTHEECPTKPGFTHHLRPVNEGRGRGGMVQRCAWCGKTEGALRSEAPGNIIPRREAAPRRTTRNHWR